MLLTSTEIGPKLANETRVLALGAFFILAPPLVSVNLLWTYITLVAIYTACFIVALRSQGGLLRNLNGLVRGSKLSKVPNWLVVMPFLSSALLLLVIIITVLQDQLGVPTGSLQARVPFIMLYNLTYSPILEEVMFRISTLGLLVSFRVLWSGTWKLRLVPLSFLSPERAKALAGIPRMSESGLRGLHWTEWLLLAITSLAFGLAHLLGGGGWETGKIITATISGLVLGISYLIYGAYASILLHWFFNFYFETFVLAGDLVHGAFHIMEETLFLLTLGQGILGLALAAAWLVSRKKTHRDAPTAYMPA